jgi:hypothetical protein
LYRTKKKPTLGKGPIINAHNDTVVEMKNTDEDEPIHILGIITDEVTIPKMDGTRGSALYKIPFRLSKYPSLLWQNLFIKAWNEPPHFSTMHRPGIA